MCVCERESVSGLNKKDTSFSCGYLKLFTASLLILFTISALTCETTGGLAVIGLPPFTSLITCKTFHMPQFTPLGIKT
jgi:hypothetical protein